MGRAVAEMKKEWKQFKQDDPGERFQHHHDRMSKKSRAHAIVSLGIGIALLAAGMLLCFIPGPGTPLIVFGLALIGAHWMWLAKKLDGGEVRIRRWGRRQKHRWHQLRART
jgi:hypothetical protein